ncbi:MAG: hypothetical protein ACXVW7_06725 [Trebonia sp.]
MRLTLLLNIALAGGAVLSAASHLHGAATLGRLGYGAYLGAVMAHFVVDGGLWRLRDPFARKFAGSRLSYLAPPPAASAVTTAPVTTPVTTAPATDASVTGIRWPP